MVSKRNRSRTRRRTRQKLDNDYDDHEEEEGDDFISAEEKVFQYENKFNKVRDIRIVSETVLQKQKQQEHKEKDPEDTNEKIRN